MVESNRFLQRANLSRAILLSLSRREHDFPSLLAKERFLENKICAFDVNLITDAVVIRYLDHYLSFTGLFTG